MSTPQYSRVESNADTALGSQFLTNDSDAHTRSWWTSSAEYFRKMNKKTRFWLMLMALLLIWLFVIYLVNGALHEKHEAHMENTKNGIEVKVPAQIKNSDELNFQVSTHLKDGQKNSLSVHDQMHDHESGALKPVHHMFRTRVFNNTFSIAQTVCRGHFEGARCHGVLAKKLTKFIPLEKTSKAMIARHQLGIQVTRKNFHFNVNGRQVAFHRIEAHPRNVTHLAFHGKWLMKRPQWLYRMKTSEYLQKLNWLRKKMGGNMHKKEIEGPKQISKDDAHKNGISDDAHEKSDAPENVDAPEEHQVKPGNDKH